MSCQVVQVDEKKNIFQNERVLRVRGQKEKLTIHKKWEYQKRLRLLHFRSLGK